MTRGILCKNPMNIMTSGIPWQGEIRPTTDPQGRLCTFDCMEDGVRAGTKTLLTYYHIHNLKTINEIINRFSPPEENNTAAYVDAVSEQMGLQPDEQLDMSDRNIVEDLITAIIMHEQGFNCCTKEQIENGINLGMKFS